MKVFVTKYALSDGIWESEARLVKDGMVELKKGKDGIPMRGGWYLHGEGREYCLDRQSAVSRAEQLRKAKVKSIEKQLAKVKAIKF